MADPTYTAAEMADFVARDGLPRPGLRSIDGWAEMGLIDRPPRPGRGQGRGRGPRRWPEAQATLYYRLHQAHSAKPQPRLQDLVNLPLWIWLEYGEEVVPPRQVRRALITWFDAPRHHSRARLRVALTAFVDSLRGRESVKSSERRALVDALLLAREKHFRTGQYDIDILRPHLMAVMGEADLEHDGLPFGAHAYLDALVRMDQVETRLASSVSYSDADLATARDAAREALQTYRTAWARHIQRNDIGALVLPTSIWAEMIQAGRIIVTVLGAMFETGLPLAGPTPTEPLRTGEALPPRPLAVPPPAMAGMWAKWFRAQAQLDELRHKLSPLEMGQLADAPRTWIGQRIDLEGSALVLSVEELPPISEDASLLASELAHHLRGVLNYLVRELAWIDSRGGPDADKLQYFPIVTEAAHWEDAKVQRVALRGLTQAHRRMIRALQPFNPAAGPQGVPHPLTLLQALDNDVKYRGQPRLHHRLLWVRPLVGLNRAGRDCHIDPAAADAAQRAWTDAVSRELKRGEEILRIPLVLSGGSPDIKLRVEGLTQVVMGAGVPIVPALATLALGLAAILRDFAREFDRPLARRVWRERGNNVDRLAAS